MSACKQCFEYSQALTSRLPQEILARVEIVALTKERDRYREALEEISSYCTKGDACVVLECFIAKKALAEVNEGKEAE